MFRPLFGGLVVACLSACGGGSKPAEAPAPAPVASAPAPAPAETAPPKKETVEDQHDSFVRSCVQRTNQKVFCECSFEQFKVIFKDADFSKPIAGNDPRVAELQTQTSKACADKLPESEVRSGFLEACTEGDKSKSPYCECAWTSLRKTLTVADFGNEEALADARGLQARKTMVSDCKGKYPAEVAKKEFLDACTKSEGSSDSLCTCRWDKLKKGLSVEEIVAGTGDVTKVKGLKECK